MDPFDEFEAELEANNQQTIGNNKNERAHALKELKRLCKEFSFKKI